VYRGICYDDEVYPEPHLFDPERFLKDGKLDRSVKDPEDRVFGAGRRYDYPRAMVLTLTDFFCFQDMPRKMVCSPKFVPQHFQHPCRVRH